MTNKQINKEGCLWKKDGYLEWKTECKDRWTGHYKVYNRPYGLYTCKFCSRKIIFENW